MALLGVIRSLSVCLTDSAKWENENLTGAKAQILTAKWEKMNRETATELGLGYGEPSPCRKSGLTSPATLRRQGLPVRLQPTSEHDWMVKLA